MVDYILQKLLEAKGYDNITQETEDKVCSKWREYDDTEDFILEDLYLNALRNESYAFSCIRDVNEHTRRALEAYNNLCESVKLTTYSTDEEKEVGREKFLRVRESVIKDIRRNDNTILQLLLLIRSLTINVTDAYCGTYNIRENTNINLKYYSDLDNELLGENYFKEMLPVYEDDVFLHKREEVESVLAWIAGNIYSRNLKVPQKEDEKLKALKKLRDFYIMHAFSLESTYFPSENEVLLDTELANTLCYLFKGSEVTKSLYGNKVILKLNNNPIYEVNRTLQNLLLDKNLAL